MPLKHLDVDEWYPVYGFCEHDIFGHTAEFTEEELADYARMMIEFERWQDIIKERFKVRE